MVKSKTTSFIVADIGGTNASFALVKIDDNNAEIIFKKKYGTKDIKKFYEIVNDFLKLCKKENKLSPNLFVLSVAGPICGNDKTRLTNRKDFIISKKTLLEKTILKEVHLINDFTALASSVPVLTKKSLATLNKNKIKNSNNIKCLLGAGTGLGKAIISEEDNSLNVLSSEGGHSDFPIDNEEEFNLIKHIKKIKKKDFISYEDVLSGKGLENIYDFYQKSGKFKSTQKKLSAEEISKTKYDNDCSKKTFELFFKIYARAAKNFFLETYSLGGVYIGGGIISKNMDFDNEAFLKEFIRNDNYDDLLSKVPIYIIKDYDSSLSGLVNYYMKNIYN